MAFLKHEIFDSSVSSPRTRLRVDVHLLAHLIHRRLATVTLREPHLAIYYRQDAVHPPTHTILFDRQDLSAASSRRRRRPLLRHAATLVALVLVCVASPASHASPHVDASAWTQIGGIPGVVAHRGGSSLAPENTLAAYRAAIGRGDRAVECDVHLSADNVPVVIHDPVLGRTTDGRGLVRRRSLRSLRRLDAGGWWSGAYDGEGVPTLEEVLDIAKNRAVVFLELKQGRGLVAAVQKVIDARPDQRDQIVLISFDGRLLRKASKKLPGVPRMLLFKKHSRYGRNMIRLARRARATMVGLDFVNIRARDVRLAHKRSLPVYAYTVNDLPRVATLVRMGIDGVITDRPFLASEVTATQAREYAARP